MHSAFCDYDINNMFDHIVSKSINTEKDKSIFEKKNGEITIRLNCLNESFKSKNQEMIMDFIRNPYKNKKVTTGLVYRNQVSTLLSYINSAASIARIFAGSSKNIEKLENTRRIKYHDQFITWKDFIYKEERYLELFKKLEAREIKHPIAVVNIYC